MNKINDGGPAFPAKISIDRKSGELQPHQFGNDDFCATGMTLRDYFAAKALAAVWRDIPDDVDQDLALRELGLRSYKMADAMLAARGEA